MKAFKNVVGGLSAIILISIVAGSIGQPIISSILFTLLWLMQIIIVSSVLVSIWCYVFEVE